MPSRVKQLLKQGKMVRVFGMGQLCDPKLVEMVGVSGGWDAVWLDQEHVALPGQLIENCTRAARAVGLDSFVRLAPTDYASVMRPYEAGAGGIMAAQVRSAEQSAEIIHWCKFHPLGLRGVNSGGIDGGYGTIPMADYLRQANDDTYVILQVEHFEAVEAIEKIAALPSLDCLFIGPADLSQSMGLPGQMDHPQVWDAIQRVATACKKTGVRWAILPKDVPYAKKCVEMGCTMLSIGFDTWIVFRGLKSFQDDYAWLPK